MIWWNNDRIFTSGDHGRWFCNKVTLGPNLVRGSIWTYQLPTQLDFPLISFPNLLLNLKLSSGWVDSSERKDTHSTTSRWASPARIGLPDSFRRKGGVSLDPTISQWDKPVRHDVRDVSRGTAQVLEMHSLSIPIFDPESEVIHSNRGLNFRWKKTFSFSIQGFQVTASTIRKNTEGGYAFPPKLHIDEQSIFNLNC